MDFVHGKALQSAIGKILREDKSCCAVAYWGAGASDRLRPNLSFENRPRIICNLEAGGTNPHEIKKLMAGYAHVRQLSSLHAKVYLGMESAVVTSANVSTNGLGIEDIQPALLTEAGVVLSETGHLDGIRAWLDDLWEKSQPITPSDLKKAVHRWFDHQRANGRMPPQAPQRQLATLPLPTDPDADFPMLYWWTDAEFSYSKQARQYVAKMLAQIGSKAAIDELLDNSLEVDLRDRELLSKGKWIIVWKANGSADPDENMPIRNMKPYWFYTGEIIPDAIKYKGNSRLYAAILGADYKGKAAPPFTLDKPTVQSFFKVVARNHFAPLREYGYPFLTKDRRAMMLKFLAEWKADLTDQ